MHKSHFKSRENRSAYSPLSNTPGIYDGSKEARAIVSNAMQETEATSVIAACILVHILHYLKGMDSVEASFTEEFFAEETDEPTSGG
jgi:hypothetical protein